MTTPEEWVRPGTEVASVRLGQGKQIAYSKINRVGKAWLFLDNGEKFHKLGLDRSEGPYTGGHLYRLYKVGDPKLKEHELDVEVHRIMRKAIKLSEEFAKNPDVTSATQLVEALIHFTPYTLTKFEQ